MNVDKTTNTTATTDAPIAYTASAGMAGPSVDCGVDVGCKGAGDVIGG